MLIATWNLNNRVGRVPFRPNAADAAISLEADVLVFTEFYAQEHEAEFASTLRDAGWSHQEISRNTDEKANRIFISSRLPLQSLEIRLPAFDQQFPSNVLCVGLPTVGLSIVGIRIPWYEKEEIALVTNAWDWLESTAAALLHQPSIILGDLNVVLTSARSRGGEHFRRILQSGWHRATPKEGASYFGEGGKHSEIDHMLGTAPCRFVNAHYVTQHGGHRFCDGTDAISDHAALLAEIEVLANTTARHNCLVV